MYREGRYAYFSSKQTSDRTGSRFEVWVRKNNWRPARLFDNDKEELLLGSTEEQGIK
jgi:hypothetical protein